MYYVVEFLEEGTIAVVPNTWMTTLETCLWPPSTAEWKNKLTKLVKIKSQPEDCFGAYNIRVLGTSEILKRANEKAKKLERGRATSEINTTDCEKKTNGRPKRKKTKRKSYSSSSDSENDLSSEEELTLSIPPPLPPPLFQFSPSLNAAAIVTDLNKDGTSLTPQSSSLTLQTQQFSPSVLQQCSVTGQNKNGPVTLLTPQSKKTKFQADGAGYFGCESFATNVGRPVALEDVNTRGMGVEALLRLNAEFHKQILRKLNLIEAEQTRQRDFLIQQSNGAYKQHRLQSLPFSLPISTKDGLIAVEEFLKMEANQDIMIRHLKLVGGAELEIVIRGILSRCMTNGMASNFSYFGLRNKENFKSLNLKKVVFNAVQLLYPEVSEADFSKIAGDWFRYAPRKKGGNKRREEKDTVRNNIADENEFEDDTFN